VASVIDASMSKLSPLQLPPLQEFLVEGRVHYLRRRHGVACGLRAGRFKGAMPPDLAFEGPVQIVFDGPMASCSLREVCSRRLRRVRFPAAAPERGNGARSTRLSFRSPRADEGALTAWLVWSQISSGRMELPIWQCRLQRSSWHVKIFGVSGALYRSECPWARTSARN
jgi:hypothetical protein